MTPQKYEIYFTEQAENDLYEIYRYVGTHDSEVAAENLYKKLYYHAMNLETMPERGSFPKELARIEILDYRELNTKPHRIIYQVIDDRVYIHAILDGRRNLDDHLTKRLANEEPVF